MTQAGYFRLPRLTVQVNGLRRLITEAVNAQHFQGFAVEQNLQHALGSPTICARAMPLRVADLLDSLRYASANLIEFPDAC